MRRKKWNKKRIGERKKEGRQGKWGGRNQRRTKKDEKGGSIKRGGKREEKNLEE